MTLLLVPFGLLFTSTLWMTTILAPVLVPHAAAAKQDNTEDAMTPQDILDLIRKSKCDYQADACKLSWQLDGECDADIKSYGCYGADCWDCDPCQHYDWDCTGCITLTDGLCSWCPTDGVCRSAATAGGPTQEYWNDKIVKSTCTNAQDWKQTCSSATGNATNDDDNKNGNVFTDPLYEANSWIYDMINVPEVWRMGITGSGIHVRINDVGLDANHVEFSARFDWNHSCGTFQSEIEGNSFHGTGVASLLAAQANNDECAVGIAPDATLSACTFQEDFLPDQLVDMLETQLDAIDISQNSWGPEVCTNLNFVRSIADDNTCLFDPTHDSSPCEDCKGQQRDELDGQCTYAINDYCTYYYENDPVACAEFLDIYISCEYHSLPDSAHQAFVRGVVEGRQGKGIIYVYAAGNSHDLGAFTNTDGFVNSRFTVGVGAVSKNGIHATYSTTGAALHVTAPGGDFDHVANNIVANPGGGCRDIAGGTSFSAPIVSGVVALMLEVNPNLGWRDVQSILAHTSQHHQVGDDSEWTINGAGLHHSYKYGFGIVDAWEAVQASQNWTNAGPEHQLVYQNQNGNLTIADDSQLPTLDTLVVRNDNGGTLAATSTNLETFVMESVVLYLDLLHSSRGDLLITLTSPMGTDSILHPSKRPENRQLQSSNETWKLTTVRNWGENPLGEWKLTIVDESRGDRGDCSNDLFEHLHFNPLSGHFEAYTCLDVEERLDCWNGVVKQAQLISQYVDRGRGNRTAADACCFCGGGIPVTDINVLKSWTLVIYGHYEANQKEEEEEDNDDIDVNADNASGIDVEMDTQENLAPPSNLNHDFANSTEDASATATDTATTTSLTNITNTTNEIESTTVEEVALTDTPLPSDLSSSTEDVEVQDEQKEVVVDDPVSAEATTNVDDSAAQSQSSSPPQCRMLFVLLMIQSTSLVWLY